VSAPRVYYGWVLAWMLGLTQMVSWGILYYGFGVMLPHMRAEMGWSEAEAGLAFTIGSVTHGLVAVISGKWLDQRGPRVLMTLCSCIGVACLLGWSQINALWQLYAVWFFIGLAMTGTLYEPAFWVVARWFRAQRSRALTVVTFWGGLASTAFIPLATWLIAGNGWRSALIALAIVLAVCTILPHALMLRRSPAELGLHVDGAPEPPPAAASTSADVGSLSAARRTPNFWLLLVAFFFSNVISGATGVYFLSLQRARGEDAAVAAWAAGLVGVMQVVGRLTLAPLGDRMPRRVMTMIVIVLQVIALATLALSTSAIALWAYVVLFGLGHGTLTPMRASLIADVFGVQAYGAINGAISVAATIARGLAPAGLGALIASQGGNYDLMLWVLVLCGGISTVAIAFLDRAPRTQRT
jgi:MFS family permease